ncbi:prothymosin alpha isoform X1 [Hyla sarda]|uniref:prothymosin alpha isoform X1 n=1 Tax=Hyla sarda TaxID=327740 RepID=UPI0024C30C3B|nr:prothymosin alpha isoform X1 [Hyla sarda]
MSNISMFHYFGGFVIRQYEGRGYVIYLSGSVNNSDTCQRRALYKSVQDLKTKEKELVEETENGKEKPANGNAENEENGDDGADNDGDEEEEVDEEDEEDEVEGDGDEDDEEDEAEGPTGKRAADDDDDEDDVDTKKQKTDEDD